MIHHWLKRLGLVIAIGVPIALGGHMLKDRLFLPQTVTSAELEALREAREPQIGQTVSLPGLDLSSIDKPVLVILLGSCSECSTRSADLRGTDVSGFLVVAVATVDEVENRDIPGAIIDQEICGDTELHEQLNAYWTPRFAFLGESGQLRAIQSDSESPGSFIERCKRLES